MAAAPESSLPWPTKTSNGKGKFSTGKTGLLARLDWLADRCLGTIIISATCLMSGATVVITCAIASQAPADNSQMVFADGVCRLCIDCAQLTRNQFTQPEVNGLSRRQENGSEMCCAETQEQISALLQASMREQVADSDAESLVNKRPVSAHKRLLPVYNNESLLKEPRFIKLEHEHFPAKFNTTFNDPLTEHALGVEVLDSAFRINYTGLYHVYLSVHIRPVFNTTLDTKVWTQYVHCDSRNNSAKTGNLLQGAYTAEGESADHEASVYTAGTFLLNKGDELQVCVNPIGVLQYNIQSSFLGVVLLNSGPV